MTCQRQLDCLLEALEWNLECMRSYMTVCEAQMSKMDESNLLYAHTHGMKSGVEFCIGELERTVLAVENQRGIKKNDTRRKD